MRLRISVRGRVRPYVHQSVRLSRVIFEQRKTSFPMLRWRRNLTWSKRQSRTIYKCHHNVGPWFCPSIRQKKMNKKCRRGSHIWWSPRFLFIQNQLCKKKFAERHDTTLLDHFYEKKVILVYFHCYSFPFVIAGRVNVKLLSVAICF